MPLRDVGIEINSVQDTNISHYTYEEGINGFVDICILQIPDDNQSKWTGTYDESYLGLKVEIKNEYGEGGEYLAFRGRIANVPEWNNGTIIVIVEGFIAQFKDKIMSAFSTVEDPDSGQTRFTGYITDILLAIDDESITRVAAADDAYFNTNTATWFNASSISAGNFSANLNNGYFRFQINRINFPTQCDLKINVSAEVGSPTLIIYLIDSDDCPQYPNGAGNESAYPTAGMPSVSWSPTGTGWKTIDITTFLQTYMERPGFSSGNYMGIKIYHNNMTSNKYVIISAVTDIGYLEVDWSGALEDDSKTWADDVYNDDYICIIDTLSTIPESERWLGHDWQSSPIPDLYIQASLDDTYWNDNTQIWIGTIITVILGSYYIGTTYRAYFRFPVNISKGSTIDSCIWNFNVFDQDGVGANRTIYLIDLDDCPTFPEGAAGESAYPVTATTVTWTHSAGTGWKSAEIKDLLQAFIDRSGYTPGSYIGIRVDTTNFGSDNRIRVYAYDNGLDISYLSITHTPSPPEKIQYLILDTTATELYLDSFSLQGLIIGNAYMITKMTSELVKDAAEDYLSEDWDESQTVTVDKSDSNIGFVKKFLDGQKPFEIFTAARNVDGFILRLKHDTAATFLYKPYADISDAGDLPEDILNFVSSSPAGTLINLVKVKDRYGIITTRGWNYTTEQPQDDSVTNNPFPMERQEMVPTSEYADITIGKEIADARLYRKAPQGQGRDITLIIDKDVNFQPGERVGFTYKSVDYGKGAGDHPNPYLITRKRYDSNLNQCELKLVDYS